MSRISELLAYATLSTVIEYLDGESTAQDIADYIGADAEEVKEWLESVIEEEKPNAEILAARYSKGQLIDFNSRFNRRMKFIPEFSAVAVHMALSI